MLRFPINEAGMLAIDTFLMAHAEKDVDHPTYYRLAEDEIYYAKTGYAATIYLNPHHSIDGNSHKLELSVKWFEDAMSIVEHLRGKHYEPTAA